MMKLEELLSYFDNGKVFGDNPELLYEMPKFQREYVWDKPDWFKFFKDLADNADEEGHFMGSIIGIEPKTVMEPKIMVIDGEVAYSGGVNLADEYINEIHPFGVWKDLGIRITGDAVRSYAYMFAEFWNAFSNDVIHLNLYKEKSSELSIPETTDGYILPYYDSPMRDDPTSNELFTEMLSTAKDYAYFYTPYLMLGDALFDAFIRAAKRGLDVRLILPGIPDKKLVFRLATTYFEDLLKAGVKIYEYDPGFVHAKASIADDKIGTIGTVNLDYRSLFLHFECNSLYYKADILKDLKADFLKTQEECHEVTLESLNTKRMHKFVDNLLRAIAPLL